jgi:hypothetical protein
MYEFSLLWVAREIHRHPCIEFGESWSVGDFNFSSSVSLLPWCCMVYKRRYQLLSDVLMALSIMIRTHFWRIVLRSWQIYTSGIYDSQYILFCMLFLNNYFVSSFQPSARAALVQTSGLYSINQFQKNCKVCTMMVTNWLVAFFSLLSLVFHFFSYSFFICVLCCIM